jgi:hypothetical protein
MKKILLILLTMLIMPYASASTPNDEITVGNPIKALVGFKYSNTSLWSLTTKGVARDVIGKNIAPMLAQNNCEMITDVKYLNKIQDKGYGDATSVERSDMLDIYKDDGFKYLIFIDMDPIRSSGFGYESSAHVKIIDMENSKYIFSGKVNGMTKWGGAGTAAFNVGKEIRKILEEKVFLPKGTIIS